MPWRKYTPEMGKHGPSYYISKGVQVRCDARKKWTVFIEKDRLRKSKTIGPGREGLVQAIRAAEAITAKIDTLRPVPSDVKQQKGMPDFKAFSKNWLKSNATRWDELTSERYEAILRR